jgi:hypothetical protein
MACGEMWTVFLAVALVGAETPRGCRPQPMDLAGSRYWSCGEDGVLVEDLADEDGVLRVFAPAPLGFRVDSLTSQGASVIVRFTPIEPAGETDRSTGAGPIERRMPRAPFRRSPDPTPDVEVEVVDTRRITVVISGGASGGLYYGDVFEFHDESGEPVAAGTVDRLSKNSADVRLWLNHPVEVGMRGVLVEWQPNRARTISPPKVDGMSSASLGASMFIQGGRRSGVNGALLHVQGRHHFDAIPLALVLDVGPAFITRDPRSDSVQLGSGGDALLAGSIDLVAELDLDIFGFGLGGGGATFNRDLRGDGRPRSAAEMVFRARLGNRDGLMVQLSPVMTFPEGAEGPLLGRIEGRFQIPLGNGFFLGAEGAGGRVGYTYGAWNLRFLAAGRGTPVSWFVSARVGGAQVRFEGQEFATTDVVGGLVGTSLQARF